MGFTTPQIAALCVGVIFAIIILLGLLFLIYASRRARHEDREAAAANVGRWNEVSEVDVPTVPNAPKLRGRPSWQSLANPPDPLLATIAHTLPSQVVNYDRMVSHGTGQQVENPYKDVRAVGSQKSDLPTVPRNERPVKAEWDREKRSRSRSRTPRSRDLERSDDRRPYRSRSSARQGDRVQSSGEARRDSRRARDTRRTRRR